MILKLILPLSRKANDDNTKHNFLVGYYRYTFISTIHTIKENSLFKEQKIYITI